MGASEMVSKGPCVDLCQLAHLFLVIITTVGECGSAYY